MPRGLTGFVSVSQAVDVYVSGGRSVGVLGGRFGVWCPSTGLVRERSAEES